MDMNPAIRISGPFTRNWDRPIRLSDMRGWCNSACGFFVRESCESSVDGFSLGTMASLISWPWWMRWTAFAANFGGLYPAYVRGEAYLAAHRGVEAAAEFQKILNHCGVVGADPVGALAHLQLGRAFALLGDKTKAKTAYQDFLTLWKDADPDIPILQQAKAEYAKLQQPKK